MNTKNLRKVVPLRSNVRIAYNVYCFIWESFVWNTTCLNPSWRCNKAATTNSHIHVALQLKQTNIKSLVYWLSFKMCRSHEYESSFLSCFPGCISERCRRILRRFRFGTKLYKVINVSSALNVNVGQLRRCLCKFSAFACNISGAFGC